MQIVTRGLSRTEKAPSIWGAVRYGTSSFQSGLPTRSARIAMLSRLIVLRAFSTSLIHDCAKPVRLVMSCCVNFAALRAARKLRAKTWRSSGTGLVALGSWLGMVARHPMAPVSFSFSFEASLTNPYGGACA